MLTLILALIAPARADDPPPCTSTISPSSSIKDSIEGAADGAVLCLESGVFPFVDTIEISEKDLTIRGAGKDLTRLELRSSATNAFELEDGAIIFEDLTLSAGMHGRVMELEDDVDLQLIRTVVTEGSHPDEGGGINFDSGAHVYIEECEFIDNVSTASGKGGGHIYMTGGSSTLTIADSVFEGGDASRGGAIFTEGGDLWISGSVFRENYAFQSSDFDNDTGGGAIAVSGGKIEVHDSEFIDNVSESSGGAILYWDSSDDFVLERSTFDGNVAAEVGGHVFAGRGDLAARQVRFYRGLANGGGAVGCFKADCHIDHSGFWFNISEAADRAGGGGIFHLEDVLYAQRNLFCGNEVVDALLNPLDATHGGGGVATRSANSVLRNNYYVGNRAFNARGGAIFAW